MSEPNSFITDGQIDHELCVYIKERQEVHGKLTVKGLTTAKLEHEVRRAFLSGMNRGLELCRDHLMQE